MSNALKAAEDALLAGDEEKLFEALKAMGIQNLQAQNKGWYLKQLLADRETKEQVGGATLSLQQRRQMYLNNLDRTDWRSALQLKILQNVCLLTTEITRMFGLI